MTATRFASRLRENHRTTWDAAGFVDLQRAELDRVGPESDQAPVLFGGAVALEPAFSDAAYEVD